MQWFVASDGYMYLGNAIKADNPFKYSGSEVILTDKMIPQEFQGIKVDVTFIYQAIQYAGMGLEINGYTQDNVNEISALEAWSEFVPDIKGIYSGEYATSYVRGTLDDTAYKTGAQVAYQKTKSPYNYFTKSSNNTGDYVAFGFFPQTIMANDVTIKEKWKGTFNGVEYYIGSDGYLYENVKENAFGVSYIYSNAEPVSQADANTYRYFKLEPIIWQVLTESDGSALLLSVSALTVSKFGDSVAYVGSTIETYLKGDFYNKAFTDNAKGKINSKVNVATDETGDGTSDETTIGTKETGSTVFLLGYKDTFTNGYFDGEAARVRYPTDYAGARYANRSDTASYGSWWWMRSRYNDNRVRFVSSSGRIQYYEYPSPSGGGYVPALFLNI